LSDRVEGLENFIAGAPLTVHIVFFAEDDKGMHTIHYTLIVVGGASAGILLLFFMYMLVSRNQHFEEVDLRPSPVRFIVARVREHLPNSHCAAG
jgi:hypothetical protein